MSAQFGLVLPAGPPKGAPEEWLEGMESLLPDLGEQVTGLWMTDHFFWDDLPTFEVWTVLSYAAAPRYFLTLRRGRNRCEKANDRSDEDSGARESGRDFIPDRAHTIEPPESDLDQVGDRRVGEG